MIKAFKIIFINTFIFFSSVIVIEIFFGYWFDKDNYGPYMREHRLRKTNYEIKYQNNKYNFIYERDYHGLRGKKKDLNLINAVMIGGSTTDERYKPEEFTITSFLNDKLKSNGIDLNIVNAGIEGQTTRGHLYNLLHWFPKIPNFKPKYYIYYIGINDQFLVSDNEDFKDGMVLGDNIFLDNIKSRSIFYDYIRKIKHKYYSKEKKIEYDFDNSIKKNDDVNFLSYKDFTRNKDIEKILSENNELIKSYLNRVKRLSEFTKTSGGVPIFINQLDAKGYNNEVLVALNTSLIRFCKRQNLKCIDVSKKLIGKKDYWWDGIHTTPKGSKVVANIIYKDLLKFLEK